MIPAMNYAACLMARSHQGPDAGRRQTDIQRRHPSTIAVLQHRTLFSAPSAGEICSHYAPASKEESGHAVTWVCKRESDTCRMGGHDGHDGRHGSVADLAPKTR
jgi:hypothetical protein